MTPRRKRGTAGDKSIYLPVNEDVNYDKLVNDREAYRKYLNEQIAKHPELFPVDIGEGYRFHGLVESSRQNLKIRRIYLPSSETAYQIRPDFVTPYMSETSEEAAKALYLRQHGLSYDGIAYVLEIRLKERKGKYPDRGNQRDLRKGNHRIVIKLLF
jgi:hypothetical protein